MTSVTKATELYKKASETTERGEYRRPLSSRIQLLEDALKLYYSELRTTVINDQRAILWKNLGMTSLRLAKALLESKNVKENRKIIYYVNGAVRNLTLSWIWRPQERDGEWGDKVIGSINAAFDAAFRSLDTESEENWSKRLHQLDTVVQEIESEPCLDRFRLLFYTERAQFYNRSAIKLMEKSNFILTVRVLEYCRCDIELARKYVSDPNPEVEPALFQLQDAEDVMRFLKASCESVKLRSAADDLLSTALNDSEEINFDFMWEILDMYKAAALAASNEDIKNETIAIARQGLLFHKIFKLESYAKMYCHKAVELGNILLTRDYGKWFNECCAVLREYQAKQREEEDRLKESERAPYLEELVEELRKLNDVANCSLKLMKHIYSAHPPKTEPNFKYDEKAVNSTTIAKILMKAIFHYHPDRQANFEQKWKVLCEEITKRLNVKYACLKGIISDLDSMEVDE